MTESQSPSMRTHGVRPLDQKDNSENLLAMSRHANPATILPRHRKWSMWILLSDTWLPEIAASMLSILCSIVIAILLFRWSGKEVPHMMKGITVNAVISILATTSKSAMLFVVATCIAQMKWIWFRESRPLEDIQTFDDASRGPYGSVYMLFHHSFLSLASIGAVITILTLAFDPFVQQSITYPSSLVSTLSSDATVKQAVGYFDLDVSTAIRDQTINTALWSHVLDQQPECITSNCSWPVFKSVSLCHQCQAIEPVITTPWEWSRQLQSIDGVPKNLSNISIGVTIGNYKPVNLSLAAMSQWYENNIYENSATEATDLYWLSYLEYATTALTWKVADLRDSRYYRCAHNEGTDCPESTTIAGIENPLLVMAFSRVDWLEGLPDISNTTVCALDLCLRSYEISVESKQSSIIQTDVTYGIKNTRGPTFTGANESTGPSLCWIPIDSDNPQYINDEYMISTDCSISDSDKTATCNHLCPYDRQSHSFCNCHDDTASSSIGPSLATIDAMAASISGRLQLSMSNDIQYWGYGGDPITYNKSSNLFDVSQTNFTWTNDSFTSIMHDTIGGPPESSTSQYTRFLSLGLNQSMSNLADAFTQLAIDRYSMPFTGYAISTAPHVHVTWYWLLLPMLLNVSAALFLMLTMWTTRKHDMPLWKNSLVALLACGLEGNRSMQRGSSRDPEDVSVSRLDGMARDWNVALRRGEGDGKLRFGKAE